MLNLWISLHKLPRGFLNWLQAFFENHTFSLPFHLSFLSFPLSFLHFRHSTSSKAHSNSQIHSLIKIQIRPLTRIKIQKLLKQRSIKRLFSSLKPVNIPYKINPLRAQQTILQRCVIIPLSYRLSQKLIQPQLLHASRQRLFHTRRLNHRANDIGVFPLYHRPLVFKPINKLLSPRGQILRLKHLIQSNDLFTKSSTLGNPECPISCLVEERIGFEIVVPARDKILCHQFLPSSALHLSCTEFLSVEFNVGNVETVTAFEGLDLRGVFHVFKHRRRADGAFFTWGEINILGLGHIEFSLPKLASECTLHHIHSSKWHIGD